MYFPLKTTSLTTQEINIENVYIENNPNVDVDGDVYQIIVYRQDMDQGLSTCNTPSINNDNLNDPLDEIVF